MRKFFKLGRTKQSSHREASTEEYLSHIPHTSGAVGWGTVDHAEPGSWEEYRQGFRQNAEGFLNAARPDMYNGGYLDGEIDSYERLAITEARHCREGILEVSTTSEFTRRQAFWSWSWPSPSWRKNSSAVKRR